MLHRSGFDGKPALSVCRFAADTGLGYAERLAALDMIEPRADRPEAITLGGDKGFDAADFVMELREINVTPHIARNSHDQVVGWR